MSDDIEVLDLEEHKDNKKSKNNSLLLINIKVLIRKFIFIVLLFYILFFHIFGFTRIKDNAMSPNIADGDLLLYYRLDKNYTIGDVVTFKENDKRYVLRIIAVGGDTVTVNSSGDFLVNGEVEYHKTYLKNNFPKEKNISYPYKVPKNKVFVIGDYRSEYRDSRILGAISIKKIDGKVISLLQTKDI